MNIAYLIAALVTGFIGGVLGSMVLHEILDQKLAKKQAEDAQAYALINHRLEQTGEQYKLVTVALEQLTYKFVRERGAVWESLNGLWNDYDERHKDQEPAEPAPEATETAEKRTKKAKKGNKTNEE